MKQLIKIKKTEGNEETTELLAASIIKIANGFEQLLSSKLQQRAYVVLLHDLIGGANISKGQIKLVLENLPRLKAWYIKK